MASFADTIGAGLNQALGTIDAYSSYVEFEKKMKTMHAENVSPDANILNYMGIGIGDERKNNSFTQEKVLKVAYSHVGGNEWTEYVNRGIFRFGTPKCNIFVYEVLLASGANVPTIGGELGKVTGGRYGNPPLARDWQNKSVIMEGWSVVLNPMPGDVVSNGRHVGFYVSRNVLLSSHPVYGVREADFNMRDSTFRRYTGAGSNVEEGDGRVTRRQWH